jgi:hypothetical protein
MSRPGFSLEREPAGQDATRVVFSFFHEPKGSWGLSSMLSSSDERSERTVSPLLRRSRTEANAEAAGILGLE